MARREVKVTSTPAFANRPAARRPTGPVPAVTTARPLEPAVLSSLVTAATAVVFDPFESSITETVKGPKNAFRTAFSSRSPALMSVPPMKMAVSCRSFGPRVKIAARFRRHAAVAHDVIRAAVVGDDPIKDAGMRRGIELQEEFAHEKKIPNPFRDLGFAPWAFALRPWALGLRPYLDADLFRVARE